MSISAFCTAEAPIAQAQSLARRIKVPPKRQTVAVASAPLVPEPR